MQVETRSTTSMRELKTHTSGLPNQGVRSIVSGMKRIFLSSSDFIRKNDGSIPHLLCLVFALSRIFELTTGRTMLHEIIKICPLLNNSEVSFPMLFSHESIYQNLDFKILPVLTTIAGRKLWSLKKF